MEEIVKVSKVSYGMMGSTVFTQDKDEFFIPIEKRELKNKVRKYHRTKLIFNYHTLSGTNFKVIDEITKAKGGIR